MNASDVTLRTVFVVFVQNNLTPSAAKEPGSGIVSSTVHNSEVGKIKMKKEDYSPISGKVRISQVTMHREH